MTPLLLLPLLAFLTCVIFHLLALDFFPRWGLLDFPERYGLLRGRLPYPTGILSVMTFLLFFLILQPLTAQSLTLLLCIAALALFCLRDDRTPLSPALRLALQILLALAIFVSGIRIYSFTNPLEGIVGGDILSLDSLTIPAGPLGLLPVASGVFTVVWLILTINALNWFDGIPGQVSALSTIAFTTLGLLSLSDRVHQPGLALLAFILAGIAAASFLFDLPPPRVVMGDTGAMFFGFMIGILTIYAGGKVATAFLVLGVPLIDLLFVVARRLIRGQSIAQGNNRDQHLHHRLLRKGWPERRIIFLTSFIGTCFGVTALFLNTFGKFVAAGVLFLLMLGLSYYSKPGDQGTQGKQGQDTLKVL